MARYELIGEKLTHSFSPIIHKEIGGYDYNLREIDYKDIKEYFEKKEFSGINVTIPYKKVAFTFMDKVSKPVKKIGALNTVINVDGKLYGFNTDYFGLKYLLELNNIEVKNKKALILGTGGTSDTAYSLLCDMKAKDIKKVSRNKCEGHIITYKKMYELYSDAQVIINTTPVGMYPNSDDVPIKLGDFKNLEAVIDVIYNPIRTNLIIEAKKRNIKADNGLYMLIYQAVVASFLFKILDIKDEDKKSEMIEAALNDKELFNRGLGKYIDGLNDEIKNLYSRIIKEKG